MNHQCSGLYRPDTTANLSVLNMAKLAHFCFEHVQLASPNQSGASWWVSPESDLSISDKKRRFGNTNNSHCSLSNQSTTSVSLIYNSKTLPSLFLAPVCHLQKPCGKKSSSYRLNLTVNCLNPWRSTVQSRLVNLDPATECEPGTHLNVSSH